MPEQYNKSLVPKNILGNKKKKIKTNLKIRLVRIVMRLRSV